jgi:hypothetical protein
MPLPNLPVSSSSSILGVDVAYTNWPLPDLRPVGVFFVKALPGGRLQEGAEVIPASWINGTRAYLLNPEPGTYYVAAATYRTGGFPTQSASFPVGGSSSVGVTVEVVEGSLATVFAEEMILQTETRIAPSCVEFMGAVRFVLGDRINANAEFQGELQKQMAELLRPGVTSASGLSGHLTSTCMVNLEKSSVSNETSDRENFLQRAADDFAKSPFSQIVSNPALCPAGP